MCRTEALFEGSFCRRGVVVSMPDLAKTAEEVVVADDVMHLEAARACSVLS